MADKVLFSSATDDWATPQALFDALDRTFRFTLDVCASEENHKCAKYFTKEQDGLKQDWGGRLYGAIRLMAERLANGFKNAPSELESPSCYCRLGQIQSGGRSSL